MVVVVGLLLMTVIPSPKTLQLKRTAGAPTLSSSSPSSNINNNVVYGEQLLGDDPKGHHTSAPLPSRKAAMAADDAEVHRDVGLAAGVDKNSATHHQHPSKAPLSPDTAVGVRPTDIISSSGSAISLAVVHNSSSSNELSQMKIDLVLYVVFQTELRGAMYQGIRWPWIPRLDDDIEPAHGGSTNNVTQRSEGDAQDYKEDENDDDDDEEEASQKRRKKTERDKDSTPATTRQIVSHMVEETHERDRTRIAFLSINPHREHHYKVLRSQLLPTFFTNGSTYSKKERKRLAVGGSSHHGGGGGDHHTNNHTIVIDRQRDVKVYPVDFKHTTFLEGRMLREWELPGYFNSSSSSTPIGRDQQHQSEQSNSAHHHLEEFGAMYSLYRSGLTLMHSADKNNILQQASEGSTARSRSSGGRRPLAADADGDGVQEWMGILQADMKIDVRLIQLIRRRIRQGTARYLGMNASSSSSSSKSLPLSSSSESKNNATKKSKKVKIMFGGRVVQRDTNRDGADDNHQPFLGDLVHKSLPKNHHCCVFYSGAYPAVFLFKNALGYVLLDLYNDFFTRRMMRLQQQQNTEISASPSSSPAAQHGNVTFEQLCAKPYTDEHGVRHSNDAILGAFVIPNSLFNSQVFPFLDYIIDLLLHKQKTFPSPEVSVDEYLDYQQQQQQQQLSSLPNSLPPLPVAPVTDVLERAVAITLGHAPRWLKIRLPVRHARDFAS